MLCCPRCRHKYGKEDRQPMIMPDCGHTYCEYCIAEILTASKKECPAPDCRKPVVTKELDKFHKNA